MAPSLILNPGKERSSFRCHPLDLRRLSRPPRRPRAAGHTVTVVTAEGKVLCPRQAWSPESQSRGRVWSFDAEGGDRPAVFKCVVVARSRGARRFPALHRQEGVRLIHGEVRRAARRDRSTATATPGGAPAHLSAGADKWREAIVAGLVQATGCAVMNERSDSEVRGWKVWRRDRPRAWRTAGGGLTIVENGVCMEVDVEGGHKTGFYLDQRDNRLLTGQLAAGRDVSTASATPAVFRCRRWPAGRSRCCRSIPPGRRWSRRGATSRSTRNWTPAVPTGTRPMCSRRCAARRTKASGST